MKNLFNLSFIFLFLSLFSCKSSESEMILCTTPPDAFYFELVDKETKENLFENKTLDSTTVKIIHSETEKEVDFQYHTHESSGMIFFMSGWETEKVTYSFMVNGLEQFRFYLDSERVSTDKCDFTKYNEVRVDGVSFEKIENTNNYVILIDTSNLKK